MVLRRSIIYLIIVVVVLLVEMLFVLQHVSVFRRKDTEWFSKNNNFVEERYYGDNRNCKVIHVGVVCMGYESNVDFYNMVESLYYYRNNPLCFHIMVDDISENILKTLFETWSAPQVEVIFYNVNSFISDPAGMINAQHYLGIHEYIKMQFSKQIPASLASKIIVIETNLRFIDDIYELWNFFHNFNEKQVIGLVENQNGDHVKSEERSPIVRKGFNTTVILYNLKKLETIQWSKLLAQIINENGFQEKNKLTNQVVINAIIRKNSDFVYLLPYNWNVQHEKNSSNYRCYNNNKLGVSKKLQSSPCLYHKKAEIPKWRTLLFIREFKHNATEDDVTFVSQLSFSKREVLEEVSRRWNGPMSITFYITVSQLDECRKFIENSKALQTRLNIAYHVVFKEGNFYPINMLRNTALRNVVTPYVFLDDIDFLPMQNLYLTLKEYIRKLENMTKKVLIVPAFQTLKYKVKIPTNMQALLRVLYKNVFPFSYKEYPVGHGPTNFIKWKTAKEPYKIKWKPGFEPYIVAQSNVAKYDERFIGYTWNKVSHILELEAQGYKFIVLPKVFIVHKYHSGSYDKHAIYNNPKNKKCMKNLYREYVRELEKKYGRKFNIH